MRYGIMNWIVSFDEPFSLRRFPFDRQRFLVKIEFQDCELGAFNKELDLPSGFPEDVL